MKHAILTEDGSTYAGVWKDDGKLFIQMHRGHLITVSLDARSIPQLRKILQAIEEEDRPLSIHAPQGGERPHTQGAAL